MNRRNFIKMSGFLAVAAGHAPLAWAEPGAGVPAVPFGNLLKPVDLLERIRLGQSALLGGLSADHHLPYWNCTFDKGDLTGFVFSTYQGEGVWDRMHNVGRALHGLSMAEAVTGQPVAAVVIEDLSRYLLGLFAAGDGLPGDIEAATGKRIVNLHNVRETLHGLTALIRRGHPEAEKTARRMVRTLRASLDDDGRIHLDRLPPCVNGYTSQPAMEGRAVDALVRYYRVSHDEAALETAALIARFSLVHCFSPAGALTEEAGSHGHSINALVAGMLDLALVSNDVGLLERARQVYDVGLPRFNSSFGWSMESLHKFRLRGEANNTGDLLRATLLLGKAGFPEYYGRAEKILRSHLLPSQLLNVSGYSDNPNATEDKQRSLASRVRGGFSFPTPNDLQYKPDAGLFTYDIVSGSVDALCETYAAVVQDNAGELRVNLLLDAKTKQLEIKSSLPAEGRLAFKTQANRTLWVRIPHWVTPAEVSLEIKGQAAETRFVGPYLLVPAMPGEGEFTVDFPLRKERTVESVLYQPYMIDWQGDQIVAMSTLPASNLAEPTPPALIPMFPRCR